MCKYIENCMFEYARTSNGILIENLLNTICTTAPPPSSSTTTKTMWKKDRRNKDYDNWISVYVESKIKKRAKKAAPTKTRMKNRRKKKKRKKDNNTLTTIHTWMWSEQIATKVKTIKQAETEKSDKHTQSLASSERPKEKRKKIRKKKQFQYNILQEATAKY